jgi:hypothetical protein
VVRIGGASAFWGDSVVGPIQLVERGEVDYLVFDYLAETTMAILAAARAKDPKLGYATDFVDVAMRDVLPTLVKKRIRVLANSGGINPQACADALKRLAAEAGVAIKVAVVDGDDLNGRLASLDAMDLDGVTPVRIPERTLSVNAYLGALPIAFALQQGADIVVTGRCVDSALTLAPLIAEFGWPADDFDRLAAGSLAGHIIECGCQATGGLYTDWQKVPNWADIGYPIIECRSDGTFSVTKPPGTGGLIERLAIAEQLVYEIGDPAEYLLPDVTCDFSQVQIAQESADRVRVSGARGRPPSARYKFSATYQDGYRSSGTMIIIGIDASAKARRTAEAILERTRSLLSREGLADYGEVLVEVIGAETMYGPHARTPASREVMMRLTVTHGSKKALEIFGREIAPSGTSWSPGTTMPPGGRPKAAPLIKQFNGLVSKADVKARVRFLGRETEISCPMGVGGIVDARDAPQPQIEDFPLGDTITMPLVALACARSGDKGDRSNIGVIARRPEYLPLILAQLTEDAVKRYFSHLVRGAVRRYLLPGISGCNFVMEEALNGGGPASLRMDPLGKGMAQMLLDFELKVPRDLADRLTETPAFARTEP